MQSVDSRYFLGTGQITFLDVSSQTLTWIKMGPPLCHPSDLELPSNICTQKSNYLPKIVIFALLWSNVAFCLFRG